MARSGDATFLVPRDRAFSTRWIRSTAHESRSFRTRLRLRLPGVNPLQNEIGAAANLPTRAWRSGPSGLLLDDDAQRSGIAPIRICSARATLRLRLGGRQQFRQQSAREPWIACASARSGELHARVPPDGRALVWATCRSGSLRCRRWPAWVGCPAELPCP